MTDLPHFDQPMRWAVAPDGSTGYGFVEQDSADDLQASAFVIVATPKGSLPFSPGFGRSELAWRSEVDVDKLAGEVAAQDSRLDPEAQETIDLADATRRSVQLAVTDGRP